MTVLTEIIWKTSTVEWHAGTAGCKIVKYLQVSQIIYQNIIIIDIPGSFYSHVHKFNAYETNVHLFLIHNRFMHISLLHINLV